MSAKKPNIILLLTDQHRLSAVSCYDPTVCRTPNIDSMAREGVRFENTYTVCPVCSPARGTIMTGVYPHTHGICCNTHDLGCSVHELQNRPTLLSRRLQNAGYNLGYTGKWHLGGNCSESFQMPNTPALPRDMGFEGQNFPGHGGGGFGYPEYQRYLAENGWEHHIAEGDEKVAWWLEGPVESTVPYFLASHTVELLDRFNESDKPFFIWHNNWGPHAPYYAPKKFVDQYRDMEIPPWPNFHWPARNIPGAHHTKLHPDSELRTWADWEREIRCYYAFTTFIDDQFGRILRHLNETGQAENTIIIFSSDHGETLGSHGGLTDKGFHHFEETHRIPLIIRFPDGRQAGTTLEELVSQADLYSTILDMGEVPHTSYDSNIAQGHSLLPLISGEAIGWLDCVITEFNGVNSCPLLQRTLRWGRYKYGFNVSGEDELYDLDLDPFEMENKFHTSGYGEVAAECRNRLLNWMIDTKDPCLGVFKQHKLAYYKDDILSHNK